MHVATGKHPDRARRWQVLALFTIIGLLFSAFSYFPAQRVTPTADAAVGGIYTVSTDGAARHMYVAEYQGLLYTLWTDFSGDPNWQLRLSQSQNAEGTSWNYPQNVNNKGAQKPDLSEDQGDGRADGRLHAVWSDAANQGACTTPGSRPGRQEPGGPQPVGIRTPSPAAARRRPSTLTPMATSSSSGTPPTRSGAGPGMPPPHQYGGIVKLARQCAPARRRGDERSHPPDLHRHGELLGLLQGPRQELEHRRRAMRSSPPGRPPIPRPRS